MRVTAFQAGCDPSGREDAGQDGVVAVEGAGGHGPAGVPLPGSEAPRFRAVLLARAGPMTEVPTTEVPTTVMTAGPGTRVRLALCCARCPLQVRMVGCRHAWR